jgi:hypothetical protein
VVYARNVTDVDDKINKKAAEEGVDIKVITDRYLAAYHQDADALGALRPTLEPQRHRAYRRDRRDDRQAGGQRPRLRRRRPRAVRHPELRRLRPAVGPRWTR